MRKHSAFRPLVMDTLEDRVLLSPVGMTAKATARHHASLSPQNVATDKLMVAYNDFITDFNIGFNNDIQEPESNGSPPDSTDFSKLFEEELKALGNGAVKSLGTQPAGAAVVTEVRQAINSPAPTSLKTQMADLTVSGLDSGAVLTSYQSRALTVIQQNYTVVKQEVLAAVPSSTTP